MKITKINYLQEYVDLAFAKLSERLPNAPAIEKMKKECMECCCEQLEIYGHLPWDNLAVFENVLFEIEPYSDDNQYDIEDGENDYPSTAIGWEAQFNTLFVELNLSIRVVFRHKVESSSTGRRYHILVYYKDPHDLVRLKLMV